MSNVSIEMGWLAKPILEQLQEQGVEISGEDGERFDRIANAICLLHIQGIIPDSVRDKAREKLMKQISKVIHK